MVVRVVTASQVMLLEPVNTTRGLYEIVTQLVTGRSLQLLEGETLTRQLLARFDAE